MAHLPVRFLQRKGRRFRSLKWADRELLAGGVLRAARDPLVGFEDALFTALEVSWKLRNFRIRFLDPAIIESALWACNLLQEQGKWEHPRGFKFQDWANRMVGPDCVFDCYYNVIERKEK